jgi:hypothetical protein
MKAEERVAAFVKLGSFLRQVSDEIIEKDQLSSMYDEMQRMIESLHIYNPWFTPENVQASIGAIAENLSQENLSNWTRPYNLNREKPLRIAVIMAGNIPLVGFHDMLCVLVSGNKFLGKLSSEDKYLLPFISKVLISIEPAFKGFIEFTEDRLKDIDAVIATGSNNTARYFEYYFGKYPHIIRKNRNSVAVLTGRETVAELRALGADVFQYFGLGCRNVSKLFVPEGYKFDTFYSSVVEYGDVIRNNKYMNNYEYNRTVYLMGSNPSLLDNNFLLLKHDMSYASPVGVLFYEYYENLESLSQRLENEREQIQCIVASEGVVKNALPFGEAQCPQLKDYADGIDTLKFLTEL